MGHIYPDLYDCVSFHEVNFCQEKVQVRASLVQFKSSFRKSYGRLCVLVNTYKIGVLHMIIYSSLCPTCNITEMQLIKEMKICNM